MKFDFLNHLTLGLDPMIASSEAGILVNMSQVPALPTSKPKEEGGGNNNGGGGNNGGMKTALEFGGDMAQQYLQVSEI